MIRKIPRYRNITRTEALTAAVLATVLASEVIVIFLLNTNYGDFLANEITTMVKLVIHTATTNYRAAYDAMGLWLFVFLIMAIIVLYTTLDLVGCRKKGLHTDSIVRKYKVLEIIKEISTPTGMLGTIVPMIYALKSIRVGLPETHPLFPMISKLSIALMTTACGLGMFIAAYLCRKILMEFLLAPKTDETKSGIGPGNDLTGGENAIHRPGSDEEEV